MALEIVVISDHTGFELKKFIIDKSNNYDVKIEINEYIELFYKKFIK